MHFLTALRAVVYMTGFVLLWGWLALGARSIGSNWTLQLPAAVRLPGAALMALGGGVVLWCIGVFVVVGRGTQAPFDPPQVFVPTGPYRWVRNPMYIGGWFLLLGFALWNHSLAMMLFSLLAAALAHLGVVFFEEPQLGGRFTFDYDVYKARVNRWIPKPPR